jgi:hypothetical protein
VKYAVGIAGIAAAGALVSSLIGNSRAAVTVLFLMGSGMVLLFVFARLSRSRSAQVTRAGIVMMWGVVSVFVIFLLFTVSAVAFGWPPHWVRLLQLEQAPAPTGPLLETVAQRVSVNDDEDSRRAIQEMLAAAAKDDESRTTVTRLLKAKLFGMSPDARDDKTRAFRRRLMAAILAANNNNLSAAFAAGELSDIDLVAMNFAGAKARGADFSESFIIGSNFEGADLTGANFSAASLRGAEFEDARLSGTDWSGRADWFNVKGLSVNNLDVRALATMELCPVPSGGQSRKDAFV